eukprot:TRINITY_DN52576_c0_g1_i2.p3 TRINITY_DN52576_c0_g1~~TRINITY_DN52576_c0_g1_i2.p3  ORF type:complete len:111 (-),score=17.77 TRINITY_DN52576_c0_g1_i2:120-452(-)
MFPVVIVGEFLVGIWLVYWTNKFAYLVEGERPSILRGFLMAAESVVGNVSELGHLWGQLERKRFQNLLMRFDWFVGSYPQGPVGEQIRSAQIFFVWCVLAWGCWQLCTQI